ncbi:unnamed protein product [Gemmataceae bacterium]|nr:unnamed protein product [Gemmataceae bacterium]VTT98956.1 unnamed protein product [Gemmataceae bacterium]
MVSRKLFVLSGLVCLLGVSAVVTAEPVSPARAKPGCVLADAGGVSGLWVQKPGAKPLVTVYAQQDLAALGFYRDATRPAEGCDFGIAATADGVHFQVRDAGGKFHMIPAAALLKLEGESGGCKCKDVPDPMPRPPAAKAVQRPKGDAPRVTFEEALRDQIESRPETIRSQRVLKVLDMEDGPRRDRILARMERHAAAHLDLAGDAKGIDWSAIDWAKLFEQLLKILTALLPFLL